MAGKTKEELVEVKLPIIPDPKAQQQEFYSVNGKNYIIKRGVAVKVPKSLAEVIANGQEAVEKAFAYVQEAQAKQAQAKLPQ